MHRVFYYLELAQREVSSAAPDTVSAGSLLDELLPCVMGEDDYIGILDSEGNLLQLSLDRDQGYWVELPQPEERRSYGRSMVAAELAELLRRLPANFERAHFTGFEPRPWATEGADRG